LVQLLNLIYDVPTPNPTIHLKKGTQGRVGRMARIQSAVDKARRLQGTTIDIQETPETKEDEYGNVWKKCIFAVRLVGFSKRTPDERLPESLRDKEVKLIRWCCFDWHYTKGARKTLNPEETEAVLKGTPISTVYW